MSRHPFGWSLPPGVTDRMIDEAAGGYDEDEYEEAEPEQETETIKCEGCDGTGSIPTDEPLDGYATLVRMIPCPLCDGTGRERADVTARKRIEGVNPDGK